MILFLCILGKTFWHSYTLFRIAKDPFIASLGLGLAGWVLCSAVANGFGDRWTFFQVNGFMWVLAGLVTRGAQLEQEPVTSPVKAESNSSEAAPVRELVECPVAYRL